MMPIQVFVLGDKQGCLLMYYIVVFSLFGLFAIVH